VAESAVVSGTTRARNGEPFAADVGCIVISASPGDLWRDGAGNGAIAGWSDLACARFQDQPHFISEFNRFTVTTPTRCQAGAAAAHSLTSGRKRLMPAMRKAGAAQLTGNRRTLPHRELTVSPAAPHKPDEFAPL
jgi:hypothetical protein